MTDFAEIAGFVLCGPDLSERALPIEYPLTVRGAADRRFLDYATGCAERHWSAFKPNSFDTERRKWWRFADDPVLDAKKQELIARFGLPGWTPEPEFGDYIGWISSGGAVHPHRDNAPRDKMHVRINLLVRKPNAGGVPLLDDFPLDIDLGDAWLCFASQCRHATTPVIGDVPRNVVSFGMQIDSVAGLPFFAKYLAWRSAASRAGAPVSFGAVAHITSTLQDAGG